MMLVTLSILILVVYFRSREKWEAEQDERRGRLGVAKDHLDSTARHLTSPRHHLATPRYLRTDARARSANLNYEFFFLSLAKTKKIRLNITTLANT